MLGDVNRFVVVVNSYSTFNAESKIRNLVDTPIEVGIGTRLKVPKTSWGWIAAIRIIKLMPIF